MTLHHLRVFIKVAECGSVSAAARECHLAQPTVSQLIKELEDFYAARLFERLSKRLYITEEGRRLLSRAKEVAGAYERLEYDMSPDKRRDRLCIGSSVTVGMCLMPSLVKRFGAARPETEIYSYVNNTQTIERMLLGSELDVAVVEGRVRSKDLLSFHCRDDYVALFCSAAHPFAARESVTLGELCCEPFVLRERGSGTREIFENFMEERGRRIKVKWEVACFDATLRAVVEEGCIGVASVRLLAPHLKSGAVRGICRADGEWDRVFSFIYHKDKFITEDIKRVASIALDGKEDELPRKEDMAKLEA